MSEDRWEVCDEAEYHVIPLGDLREHVLSWECWCNPDCDTGVCVHHALDQREKYETGELQCH